MVKTYQNNRLVTALLTIFVLIIILVPFHGFITTWVGSNFGNVLLWRAWKEILLLPAALGVLWLLWRDRDLRDSFWSRPLNRLMVVCAVLLMVTSVLLNTDTDSLALGLAIQLRLFAVFILAQVISYYRQFSRREIVMLLLIPAGLVVAFGVLQLLVLPYDFLRHFGYEKGATIPPYFTIDEQLDKIRIASTLRGPNPLGVYLILPALILATRIWETHLKKGLGYLLTIFYFILLLVVLYGSHSRGAWLGLASALGIWILLKAPKRWRLGIITAALLAGVITSAGIYQYRHSNFVENVVLHDDPESGGDISSNTGHLNAIKEGLSDIKRRPLTGCGAGCAGPASVHHPSGAKISENYFIQTAQETGVIGLAALITIFLLVVAALYKCGHPLASPFIAAFVGIGAASMLAHSWADDTIAYLWWGLAGAIVYNETKGKQNNGKKKKITDNSTD